MNLFRQVAAARRVTLLLAAALLACSSGCQALYFIAGKGSVPAQYTLPKDARILVFVDPRPNVTVPVDLPSTLGDKIGQHLYKYGLADRLVAQERLTAVRRDASRFVNMGIADVAKATDADIVLYVDLVAYDVSAISDNSIAQGSAHVMVKVLDRSGARLWPKNAPTGAETAAEVDPAFTSDRDIRGVTQALTDLLALRVGRMFQKYDREDPVLAR